MANENNNQENKEKRFYWLKLNDGFFKDRRIQLILGMRNGEKYLIFYLKLLCESIRTEGLLRFNERFAYTDEMLSALTNTDIDTVLSAKEVLIQLELIEVWEDLTIHMNGSEHMIGSESASAERARRFREKKEQAALNAAAEREKLVSKSTDENTDPLQERYISITPALQCNATPLQCNEKALQSNVENRDKILDIRDKEYRDKDIIMSDIEDFNNSNKARAHANIATNNINSNKRVECFFTDILRLDVLRNRVECASTNNPEYLKFFDEFIEILKHPYSEKNRQDLLKANMTTIYEVFNNLQKIKIQTVYLGREPINDLPRYVWAALGNAVIAQKDLLDEEEYSRACHKCGTDRVNEILVRIRKIRELNPDVAINAKYAVYTLAELMQQGVDISTYSDKKLLKIIDPFSDGIIDLNSDK